MERFCTLVLIRDLMFRSKIDAIAEALGTQVYYGADLASARSLLDQVRPHLVLTDLSDPNFPPSEIASLIREKAPEAILVGFASHVELKALDLARRVGFRKVFSRNEFSMKLPNLLADPNSAV